jgi:hypothetical protein
MMLQQLLALLSAYSSGRLVYSGAEPDGEFGDSEDFEKNLPPTQLMAVSAIPYFYLR